MFFFEILAWYNRSAQASEAFCQSKFIPCGCHSTRILTETWCGIAALSSKWAIEDVKAMYSYKLKATCGANQYAKTCEM